MATRNAVTGDKIQTKITGKAAMKSYDENYDKIFGAKEYTEEELAAQQESLANRKLASGKPAVPYPY